MIEIVGAFYIHFLYAATILFIFCLLLLYVVSKFTEPEPEEKIKGMIWSPALWHAETEELKAYPIWMNYRFLSILLFIATAIIVGWFW